jgi:RHS repeat-associated protein
MHLSTLRIGIMSTAFACTLQVLSAHATTINYTYTALGQVASVDGPRTDVADITRYTYDAQGNLSRVTNALGQVTMLANFDSFGRPQSITDPNGVVTTLTYTPQGWLASSNVAGATTQYAYNAVGDVTLVTAPDASYLAYVYDDARRLVGVTNSLGETLSYTLDAMGNRTYSSTTYANGELARQQQRTYDELGRLLTSVGANRQITRYGYDLNDQLTLRTDARRRRSVLAFDALGRVAQVTNALGGITALNYDADDNLQQLIDARGVTTQYTYDGQGRMLEARSPNQGTSNFTYDEAGNVTQKTDARGVITAYRYDALNRLIAQSYPATPALNVSYTYDQTVSGNKGVGRLTSRHDAVGTVTFRYDDSGRLVSQDRTLNQAGLTSIDVLAYFYDKSSRVIQQDYPDELSVVYSRNADGQVVAVDLTFRGQSYNVANDIVYMPFGPIKQLTWSNDWGLTRTYDQDYQLSAQTMGNWKTQYVYDAVGNVTSKQSNVLGSRQYEYDALNRLTRERNVDTQKDYVLDAVGNRIKRITTDLVTGTVSDTQQAIVAVQSNRLDTVNNLPLVYDSTGNILQHANGLRYVYDDNGRMSSVYQADTQKVADYYYNDLGQRTLNLAYDPLSGVLESTSSYLYGPNGELSGQSDYNSTGQRQRARYWIWLDELPLAQVEIGFSQGVSSTWEMVYLHPDHLNTPRLATNQKTVVWSWNSDAYGFASPNEDVDGNGNATHIPLRLPGQLYDEDTRLYYNYFRDYDANLGRYVQTDPIGLNGGVNTYVYVADNPLKYFDFYGLKVLFDDQAKDIQKVKNMYDRLRAAKHGKKICQTLERRPETYTITTTDAGGSAFYEGSRRTIRIDPGFSPLIYTEQGIMRADPVTILGHEIGHAATKTWDDGLGRMNNINKNENPIREQLHLPRRTKYELAPEGGLL